MHDTELASFLMFFKSFINKRFLTQQQTLTVFISILSQDFKYLVTI